MFIEGKRKRIVFCRRMQLMRVFVCIVSCRDVFSGVPDDLFGKVSV